VDFNMMRMGEMKQKRTGAAHCLCTTDFLHLCPKSSGKENNVKMKVK
jgi:hypothetical protein